MGSPKLFTNNTKTLQSKLTDSELKVVKFFLCHLDFDVSNSVSGGFLGKVLSSIGIYDTEDLSNRNRVDYEKDVRINM